MSSFAQKKQKTQATRRRTKKRRLAADLSEEVEGGQTRAAHAGEVDTDSRAEAPRVLDKDEPSFIAAPAFDGPRPGYAFKVGPCGVGYYRFDDGESDDENGPTGGGTLEGKPSVDVAPVEKVEVLPSAEECLLRAVGCYRKIRAADGRQKAAVVVLVDSDKQLAKLPPKFGFAQVKRKAKSRRGVGSETKSKFEFPGVGCINSALTKDEQSVSATLTQYRSGKLSTLFVSDDCVALLTPLAARTSVVLQVTRFPSLATFRARRDLLAGQYGQQAGLAAKRSECFFSVPPSSASSTRAEARMLASRLRHEGREVSQSLLALCEELKG